MKIPRGSITEISKRIQREIFRLKKPISRRNTLCIARESGAFLAEKISGDPAKAQRKRVWWGEEEQRSDQAFAQKGKTRDA